MAQELMEYLRGRKPRGFAAVPHYFPDGDFVSFYIANKRCFAERVDELLTVYRSFQTRELVGCKIKGVRRLLNGGGSIQVVVYDRPILLDVLIIAAKNEAPEDAKDVYEELASITRRAVLDPKELAGAMTAA